MFYRDLARDRGLGDHPDEDAAKMALVEAFPALYSNFLEPKKAKLRADAVSAGSSAMRPRHRQTRSGWIECLTGGGQRKKPKSR